MGFLLSRFGWPKVGAQVEVVGRLPSSSTKFLRIPLRRPVVSTGFPEPLLRLVVEAGIGGELPGLPRFQYTITYQGASGVPDTP